MAVASLDLHYRMADCTSDFLKQLLCGTQRLCASATLGWVPFQGAEEDFRTCTLVASEQHTWGGKPLLATGGSARLSSMG